MITSALAAAGVAASLSLLEVVTGRNGFVRQALGWALLRMAIDGAAGAVAYQPVRAAATGLPELLVIVLSGAAGAAALRSYVVTLQKGGTQVGVISIYDKIKRWTDEKIAGAVSIARRQWLESTVEPTLNSVSADEIIEWVISYLEDQPTYMDGTNEKGLATIRGALEAAKPQTDDRHAWVQFYRTIIGAGGLDVLAKQTKYLGREAIRSNQSLASRAHARPVR